MLFETHAPKVSFEQVERELRGRNFGILSTVFPTQDEVAISHI
jgi:hypothetical protein